MYFDQGEDSKKLDGGTSGPPECYPASTTATTSTTAGVPVPVDCKVGNWSAWSKCSLSCGMGAKKTRSRKVVREAENGGAACPDLQETAICEFVQACPGGTSLDHILGAISTAQVDIWPI